MNRYTGERPCPGCDRPGSESPRGYADEVCFECKKALRYGYNVVEDDDGRSCRVVLDGYVSHLFTWRAGDHYKRTIKPPYLSGQSDNGSSKQLQQSLINFIETLHTGLKPDHMATLKNGSTDRSSVFYLPYNQGKMFFKFWDALTKYIKRLQKESYEEGTKLLKGLNDGSMTMDDFEDSLGRIKDK